MHASVCTIFLWAAVLRNQADGQASNETDLPFLTLGFANPALDPSISVSMAIKKFCVQLTSVDMGAQNMPPHPIMLPSILMSPKVSVGWVEDIFLVTDLLIMLDY